MITLDHLIFRLKRLFFIRFLSSPINIDQIDYQKIMSFNGGLLTLLNQNKQQQRIPFIYINKQVYIPHINEINLSSISTFCMANKYELEYLRLISLYDYLSSDENNDKLIHFLSNNNLNLIPIDFYSEQKYSMIMSFQDFHYHEYQRRTQQQKNLIYYDDDSHKHQQDGGNLQYHRNKNGHYLILNYNGQYYFKTINSSSLIRLSFSSSSVQFALFVCACVCVYILYTYARLI